MSRSRQRPASRLHVLLAAAIALAAPAAASAASPPPAFALCAACHPVTPAGGDGMGPNLHGVVGRKAGSAPGFAYSRALQKASFTWTAADLDAFLANPAAKAPGNAMPAAPVRSSADRQAIIAYLSSLGDPAKAPARERRRAR